MTNIALFDTSFHCTLPEPVKTYAIDQTVARDKGLRKYGFHGLSYSFIVRSVATYLNKPQSELNIVALHLGSGASACAVQNGQSVDTSMGLTPLSGLPGASRSGDVDPSLIFHYTSDASKMSPSSTKELHIALAEEILNKKSGWKALSGTANFGEIIEDDASENCQLAFDIFVDRVVGFIGSYFVKLGGKVDALVFAGGIGEKSAPLRKKVVEKCQCLGFAIDEEMNTSLGKCRVASVGEGSRARTLVCRTDEAVSLLSAKRTKSSTVMN